MQHSEGPSRRAVLRGAAVAGAAVWTVPVVQVATMTRASAAQPSSADPCLDKAANPEICRGGSDTGTIAAVGGTALVAGTALVVAAQRRRQLQQDGDEPDGPEPAPPVA